MMDGLKDAHREAITAVIAANDRVERAVLFGSRAMGTNTVSSDVDIALFGERLTLTDQARIAVALEEIPMAQSVDVLLFDSIRDRTLREHIRVHGVEWYAHRRPELGSPAASTGCLRNFGGWSDTTLGHVIELKRGYDLPQRERVPGGVPVVSSSGITGYHVESKVLGPGVVTGRYGTLGEVYFIRGDFWPLNTTLYVRDFKRNDPRFVSYWLRGLDFSGHSDKAAVPGLNRNHMHEEHVRIPSDFREQRTIAHILGTLDDKIELNRRMNATLEAMARALFRSWFVDFDPVRAKMEGRDSGLPKQIADLFPDRLVDSELGDIPEGWKYVPVSDLASVRGGKQLPKSRFVKNGPVPVFGGAGLMGYTDTYSTEGYVITVGRVGAYCGQFFAHRGKVWVNNNASHVSQYEHVPGEWLLLTLQHLNVDLIKKGAAQPFVSNSDLAAMRVVEPSIAVLKEFQMLSEPLSSRSFQIENASRMLAVLRDALLPKLVSGELRVSGLGLASVRDERPASAGTSGT